MSEPNDRADQASPGAASFAIGEALLRSILNGIPEGLNVIDLSYTSVFANTWLERTNPGRAPLVGRKCYEVYHNAREVCPWCPSKRAMETGSVQTALIADPSPTSATGWLELTAFPLYDASGVLVGVVEHVKDVTEKHNAERGRDESEERRRTVLDLAPDGIVVMDTAGRIVEANRAFCAFFGCRHEEAIGKHVSELPGILPTDAPRIDALFATLLTGSIPPSIPFEWTANDGERRWGEAHASLLRVDGKVRGITAVLHDTTERVLTEKALRERDAQLQQAQRMEAVCRLAGGIAHDFNNILTALRGYAELLDTEETLAGEPREWLHEILHASDRASALTRQLLSISRRQVTELRILSLDRLLPEMEGMLGRLLHEGIRLRVSVGEGAPLVLADAGQLQQALTCLVENACDALPQGGQIDISVDGTDIAEVEARRLGVEPGRWARLIVRDDGVGMDEETMRHLFEPFYTTKPQGKGTGLGLSTVYGIVSRAGGKVWAESRPDKGTIMTILYPVAPPGAVDESAPSDGAVLPTGTESVLVVEDEPAVRELAKRVLVRLGYEVSLAANGSEGIDAARTLTRLDLVLTDVIMPEMNGAELARRLGALRPDTRVLFMSGYLGQTVEQARQVLEAGPLLQKPFTAATLARAVRAALDRP